jgi:hypothetical protein
MYMQCKTCNKYYKCNKTYCLGKNEHDCIVDCRCDNCYNTFSINKTYCNTIPIKLNEIVAVLL